MKLVLLLFAALTAFAQQPAPAKADVKKARVEGIVVSIDGTPVSRAQVRAEILPSYQNGAALSGDRYATLSGDDGKFAIENIAPGTVALIAQKTGFIDANYGARTPNALPVTFVLDAGESLGGLRITMTPQGSINGRVVDANGEPLQNAQVSLTPRSRPGSSVAQLLRGSPSSNTNDQGEFRIAGVAAGSYYLQATPRQDSFDLKKPVPIATYYPSTADMKSAVLVDVTVGQALRAYEIRVLQGRLYSASGKILDAAGPPNTIILVSPKSAASADPVRTSRAIDQARPDGAFTVRNLSPGTYQVRIARNGNLESAAIVGEFTVVDKDLTDLTFRSVPSVSLTGSVRLEDGDLQALLPALPTDPKQLAQSAQMAAEAELMRALLGITVSGLRLSVGLTGTAPSLLAAVGSPSALVKADGTFALENVSPDSYTLNLGAIPSGLYLKSARYGDTDVTHAPFVPSGGAKLEIVLAKNAANVTGKLLSTSSENLLGMTVSLWSVDTDLGSNTRGVRTATTDRKGVFNFHDLPPGTYYAAAWEDIDFDLALARDFVSLLTAEATKVELKEGAAESLQLKIVPMATIKTAEEKLP